MDFQGTIKAVSQPQERQGKDGKTYRIADVEIVDLTKEFGDSCIVTAFDEMIDKAIAHMNCKVTAQLSIRTAEHEGRKYNRIRMWGICDG